jgi:hypothetical protein
MKEHLRMIRDTNFPERSNCKKMAQKDCSHNLNKSREEGDSPMNSAQSVNYNTTVTFNLELRSIPGCKK